MWILVTIGCIAHATEIVSSFWKLIQYVTRCRYYYGTHNYAIFVSFPFWTLCIMIRKYLAKLFIESKSKLNVIITDVPLLIPRWLFAGRSLDAKWIPGGGFKSKWTSEIAAFTEMYYQVMNIEVVVQKKWMGIICGHRTNSCRVSVFGVQLLYVLAYCPI